MNKIVYPTDSRELMGILNRVVDTVGQELEDRKVKVADTLELPKKWGGYEVPLALNELSAAGFRHCYADFLECFSDEDYEQLARHVIRDTRKQQTIVIGGALVSRCKKSKRPGLLIYWSR